MAQAQVVITAVDKTQAAINSAMRSMKTLERTAKATAKTLNLAFGLLTGAAFIGAFKKITEAAKQTEEGTQALDKFNKALKDPALVSAANSFVTAMVKGFTFIVELSASAIKNVREFGQSIGLLNAPTMTRPAGQRGSRGRGTYNAPDELSLMINQWKLRQQIAKAEEKFAADAIKAERNVAREVEAVKDIYAERFREMREAYMETPKLIESSFDIESMGLDKSVQATLSTLQEKEELYNSFARDIGSAMTDAFAEFLFDPFKNGLDGMLKGFLNVVRQIVAQIAAVEILTAIFAPFAGSSGIGGRIYKSLTARAMGGPVSGGRPYIVGERGPELFVPNSSGGIVPNNRLGMGGGFTLAPVYNIDARGATAELSQALPGILQENNRRIFDELDRRYGIGR